MLNTRQLEAFRRVMETGSISRAGQLLHLSQPAVSKLIAGLEQRLGIRLFLRQNQRLVATAEAGLLLEKVDQLFSSFDGVERLAVDLRRVVAGNLEIAGMPAIGIALLPQIIAAFQGEREHAAVSLRVASSPKIVELAISQQIDVGLGLLPADHPAVTSEIVCTLKTVCVLPKGHRLAGEPVISPAHLRGETLVELGEEDNARHIIGQLFRQAGVAPRVMTRVELGASACEFVQLGAGVSVVDPLSAARAFPDLVVKRMEPSADFNLHMLLPNKRVPSELREVFIGHVRAGIVAWLAAFEERLG
jgi:DNA-binding transcriptional LysR family regulator